MSGLLKDLPCDICGSRGETNGIVFGDRPFVYCSIHNQDEVDEVKLKLYTELSEFKPPPGMKGYDKKTLEDGFRKNWGRLMFRNGQIIECDIDGNPRNGC